MSLTPEEMKLYIELDSALARVRGNKGLYKRMLGMFTASEEFAALEEALQQKDYSRGAEVAHGIKGMTGNLGLTKVFEASEQLMVQMRAGAPDDALVAAYHKDLEKTREAVAQLAEELA